MRLLHHRLLYRSDRNYDEAIKCYKNALRQDKDNMQILRDLAQLQVQMRDVAGFVDTRHTLLQLKPANRAHWIAFAIAHHLGKNYEVAVQVLDAYAATLDAVTADEAYGYSEMLLYKGIIMEEAGWHQQALDHLNKTEVGHGVYSGVYSGVHSGVHSGVYSGVLYGVVACVCV